MTARALVVVAVVAALGGCSKKAKHYEDAGAGSAARGDAGQAVDAGKLAAEFDKKCVGGDLESCRNLGVMYGEGTGVKQDHARAAALFNQACSGGNLASCNHLALALAKGLGVAKDPAQAAELYNRACTAGHAIACGNLGLMLRAGDGVAQDLSRAAGLLDQACAAGAAFACTNAGNLDAELAVKEPARKAELQKRMLDHFTRGCNADDPAACRQVGVAYLEGFGVPKSAVASIVWLTRGCDRDDATACRLLGILVRDGLGTARDPARAQALLKRACDRKDDQACTLLAGDPKAPAGDAGVARDASSADASKVRSE